MGQYECHVFVCTSGEICPTQGDVEKFVKVLRSGAQQAGKRTEVRVNKAGCFSQCGHGPMIVVYPENVWYAGVQESDLDEILQSHILGGRPVERLRYEPRVKGANKIDLPKKGEAGSHAAGGAAEPGSQAAATGKAATSQGPAAAWRRVCRADEVPANGMKQFSVDGTDVLVVHTGSELRAFQAICPHEAFPLETGIHDGCTLTCIEHMWQFDLKTGAPMGDATVGLKGYPVKQEGPEVHVDLAQGA